MLIDNCCNNKNNNKNLHRNKNNMYMSSGTRETFGSCIWFLFVATILQLLLPIHAWLPDVRPDLQPKQDKIIAKFIGNPKDYFKLLAHDEDTILVGARDVVYNITLNGLRERSRLQWLSSDADRELCALKGKTEADCHNYIRVFAQLNDNQLLLCGTNSYKPRCRHYAPNLNDSRITSAAKLTQYEIASDAEAQGFCPYSPSHNSTYIFADGQLYSATVADFSGSDPLIYRENLRTEQYDLKQLNQPDFVGAIERNGYVLFFFREIAMEYMNFGKAIYSRVGRVCKNDRGGPYTLSKSWTSFLKTRLNCSVPGEYPFYFDEIQAISPIIESGSLSLIYAVFTTPTNAISGSAVCAFNVDDIMSAFDGNFKSQKDSQSHWMPLQEEQVPEPRPGQCVEDSRMLSSISVNFVKNHPLMEEAVPAVYGRPLLTKVNLHHRLTAIAVDAQIMALDGAYYDVIYVGTDDGKVTKFINVPRASTLTANNTERLETRVISEMQVLKSGLPVRELLVNSASNTLLVVNDGSLLTVPLHHCAHIVDCLGCLSLQDPICAWDQQNHECKSLIGNNNKFGTKYFLQSLNTTKKGAAALCPKSTRGEIVSSQQPSIGADVLESQAKEELLLLKKLHYSKIGGSSGTLSGIGVVSNEEGVSSDSLNANSETASGAGNDYLLNSFSDSNMNGRNDGDELLNELDASVDAHKLQLAGKSYYWGFAMIVLTLVFLIGVIVGLYVSKRVCKATSLHANHRNQFTSNSQFGLKHHNSGKDINLLMNPNHYHCNPTKKPNLDLEKDRSHECKNSTENLEKELPCKTSTLTKVKLTKHNNSGQLLIKCADEEYGEAHPHCDHGPAILFCYKTDSTNNGTNDFYGCAAFRDKRDCGFHLSVAKITQQHLDRRYDAPVKQYRGKFQKMQAYKQQALHFCQECNELLCDADVTKHAQHELLKFLTEQQMKDPTQFLRPLNNDKAQAQYFFDNKALIFFYNCFQKLEISKIVCIGAPRLHSFLGKETGDRKIQSFLLDFDYRFYNFFADTEFAWFNMCNNHFFDNQQKERFYEFLITKPNERLLLFTDPPFGCRTEPIAHTLQQLKRLFNKLNKRLNQPLPIFWIFPYYSEHYIQKEMPEMQMCDYKINYTNHDCYTDAGSAARKLGSPVRLFTNVPLKFIKLQSEEGYKYCKFCRRYTGLENQHCKKCQNCPSKNGSTYRHCALCGICVKPNYIHCMQCRRCTQTEGHDCLEYQKQQHCRICLHKGHIEPNCKLLNALGRKLKKQQTKIVSCYLCGARGHNELQCRKRHKYLVENTFLSERLVSLNFKEINLFTNNKQQL